MTITDFDRLSTALDFYREDNELLKTEVERLRTQYDITLRDHGNALLEIERLKAALREIAASKSFMHCTQRARAALEGKP